MIERKCAIEIIKRFITHPIIVDKPGSPLSEILRRGDSPTLLGLAALDALVK